MIEYINMKRYTSFLSLLVVAFGINFAHASECVDDDCYLDEDITVIEMAHPTQDEDVLKPVLPDNNFWIDDDFSYEISDESFMCGYDYGCPFDTVWECEIWNKKPVYNEIVTPRSEHLSSVKMDGILATLTFEGDIDSENPLAQPLLERYQILMRASKNCCSEGIIHKMRSKDISDKKIYKFLKDDANDFGVGSRCLVMQNREIADSYSNGVTGEMVERVRNTCLCKNRQWFDSLLEPFYDLYQMAPDFEHSPFYYTYMDGFQREVTVSINQEVQNVMELLQYCPD